MSDPNKPESEGYSEEVGELEMAEGYQESAEGGAPQDNQLNADELDNDRLNELWMRRVTQDPAVFLSLKFDYQLQLQEGEIQE